MGVYYSTHGQSLEKSSGARNRAPILENGKVRPERRNRKASAAEISSGPLPFHPPTPRHLILIGAPANT